MLRSIVFLPVHISEPHRWVMVCAEYCALRRYQVVAVVHSWVDAMKFINDGRATVIVTGRRNHLPPDREPRLEVVAEQQIRPESPARRRPKRRMVRRQVP